MTRRPPPGLVVALAAAVLWAWLAARTPTSTFHFAPMIVAGAWVALEGVSPTVPGRRTIVWLATLGALIALVATLVIDAAGHLDGPVFWDESDQAPVVVEHVLFAVLGAAVGAGIAWRRVARVARARP